MPTPALAPVGECFGESGPDDLRAFRAACRAEEVAALSYWSLDELDAAEAAAIAEDAAEAPSSGPGNHSGAHATVRLPEGVRRRVVSAFDGAWQATEQAAAAVVEAQRKIAEAKEAIGV